MAATRCQDWARLQTGTLPQPNVLRPGFLDLLRDLAGQALRGDDARERAEAENPPVQRAVDADVERHAHATGRQFRHALRRVPLARADVVGDRRLEVDLRSRSGGPEWTPSECGNAVSGSSRIQSA